MALAKEFEFLNLYVIQTLLVKGILHMILDIVQRDENKACDCTQYVNYPVGRTII